MCKNNLENPEVSNLMILNLDLTGDVNSLLRE